MKSTRIINLSFFMMLCIVWTHSRLPALENVPGYFHKLSLFNEVGQDAVPVFFLITGFLFFRNFSMEKYASKLRSRFWSLVIPYIVWNAIGALFWFFVISLSEYKYVGGSYYFDNIFEVIGDIFAAKYNVLWYIGVIIVYAIAAPLFYYLSKWGKIIGTISVVVFFIVGSTFHHPFCSPLLWMSVYMLGALLGTYYKDYMFKPQHWALTVSSFILFPITVYLDHQYGTMLTVNLRMWASLFFFIGLYDMLNAIFHFKTYRVYSYSLFLYATHYIPIHVLQRYIIINGGSTAYCWIAYLLVPIFVVCAVLCTAYLLDKHANRVYKFLSGNR